jgi:membrane protein required for colicin V production
VTWIDIVLIIILFGLVIHGMVIGLIRGVFDIVGIIFGYILAVSFSKAIKIPQFLAFLLIFIIVVVAISIIGRIISKIIHITPLGFIDRILGAVLGFVKAFVVCFVFLIIILLIKKSDLALRKSEIAPWVLKGGLTASQILPKKWYRWIEEIIMKKDLVQDYENHHFPL